MTAEAADGRDRPHLRGRRGLERSAGAELVIEAVFEDFDLKARLFEALEPDRWRRRAGGHQHELPAGRAISPSTPADPARFLGLHYFSPAAVNPIVEVVQGEATATPRSRRRWLLRGQRQARRYAAGTATASPSTVLLPLHQRGGQRRWTTGWARPAEIDQVAKEVLGAAAGPFAVMNLIKPRINLHAIRNLAPLGTFYAPARADDRGRRGRPAVRRSAPADGARAPASGRQSPTGCCAALPAGAPGDRRGVWPAPAVFDLRRRARR